MWNACMSLFVNIPKEYDALLLLPIYGDSSNALFLKQWMVVWALRFLFGAMLKGNVLDKKDTGLSHVKVSVV